MRAAHALERGKQLFAIDATRRQQLPSRRALLFDEGEEQMLGRDVRIAE